MSVNIKNVTVTFKNQVRAVDHVNLEIPHGVYGLLGENGAGKTTLMRVLTTVLTPSDGEVYLDGIRYGTGKDEVIRQKIGYLPQELNLYPGLSVQDCLEYLGELSGIPKEECKKAYPLLSGKDRAYESPEKENASAFRRNEAKSRTHSGTSE